MSRVSQLSAVAIITMFLTTVGVMGWAQESSAPSAVNADRPNAQQGHVIKGPFKESKPCGGKGKKGVKSGERRGKGGQLKTLGGNPMEGLNVSKSKCPE